MDALSKRKQVADAEIIADQHGLVQYALPSVRHEDGNAFMILGGWSKRAQAAGWSDKAIQSVIDMARADDYTHLRNVIKQTTIHKEPTA